MTTTSLITGATAGIGRSFAETLAARGSDVVLVARDEARLRALADELTSRHGVRAEVVVADLTTEAGRDAVEERVAATTDPVDLLVNNAGFGAGNAFVDNDLEVEQRLLDIHVTVPMRLTHVALRQMVPRRTGAIVNVASVAGFLPRGTYSVHKSWQIKFSQWMARVHAADGVKVMALCPGFVRTEFHGRLGADTSGMPRLLWLSADRVVADALRDLDRGVVVSVPSKRYTMLTTLSRVVPDRVLMRFADVGR